MKKYTTHFKILSGCLLIIIVVQLITAKFNTRLDLTKDKRYTLSENAKEIIATLEAPLLVEVFLSGNLPSEFRKLKIETQQLLEEFAQTNDEIIFEFINPLENEENPEVIERQLFEMGIKPAQVQTKENGKVSTERVYPWALAYYNEKTVAIPLLKNQLGSTQQDRITNSIQNLEYAFADGFSKLTQPKKRKIAVLKGNEQLDDKFIADFLSTLKEYYYLAQFTLDSVASNPQKTFEDLKEFDMIIAAGPKTPFTDQEKYVLDQFIMNGGASLWLVEGAQSILDPISKNVLYVGNDLNLNDFFFKYGVRINQNLIKDLYCAPIALASGESNDTQYNQFPWLLSPLITANNNHPISTNIDAVKLDYASTLDTLPNGISKTILLSTSTLSKPLGLPFEINFDKEIPENLKLVNEGPTEDFLNKTNLTTGVLLEGTFTSVFKNRVKPFALKTSFQQSTATKMVIISDSDIIKNQLDKGRPLELGFDKWTQNFFGNKEFLLNTVNYLLEDTGLINLRAKNISIAFLDAQKVSAQKTSWQFINLVTPLIILFLLALLINGFRKRKFSR